ncbi:heavy metal translocating P-type ATPase [Candidatus Nomurabacteria bacterium]|nr:heavy metal translocating P-type ATPase [Candidatus Nomurabacteria bacterium]
MNHSHHHNHHEHHQSHGMSHGSAKEYLKRFWIVTFLLIPLVLVHPKISELLGISALEISKWVQFAIATIIFGFALVFFQHALHEIKARQYGMMTLVSIAVGAGYLFSVASTFLSTIDVEFYLEISTLIWVLLFGHYLEAKSSASAGNALQEVAKLLPKKAHLLKDGEEHDVEISTLKEGDIVLVKPGEKIPADGIILEGSAHIDESLISGESKPIQKSSNDEVVAGSICTDGSLKVRLNRVGENSTVGQIQKLISSAQQTKPRSQKIANRASAVLTFVAGITALLTLLVWTLVIGESFVFAITLAITVLVIACPHALGLAIPTVTTITTSLAVKNGLFIKNLSKIEVIKKASYVVFDKTGTLTEGKFGVTDVVPFVSYTEEQVLSIAGSLEQESSHIIGISIVNHAKNNNIPLSNISNFKNVAGKGIEAKYDGVQYIVGNKRFTTDEKVDLKESENVFKKLTAEGKTTVILSDKKTVIGLIALADKIKEESYKAIEDLHKMDIKVAMLTGDNIQVAESVASELGIDTYYAEVLPEDKYKHIKNLQYEGNIVLMVGDGVNDAPALTQANIGIAIGAGTDVAVESGDVVLTNSNPLNVVSLVKLSKVVYRKMIQNLVWALGYNIIAIPAGAGVFAFCGFFLRPEIGALVMSLSTVIVVINAMTLKKVNLAS